MSLLFILVTERRWHCFEQIKTMSLDYEALMVLSGDGLIHEIFNAFAAREDASEAFAIPVVQIPTGSGNGFSISLLGIEVCCSPQSMI
jgi:sphingosine kinase